MENAILIILLPQFADWEVAFTSATLNDQIQNIKSRYFVKTVGLTKDPIQSIGGLTILPDYSIATMPTEYAALLLIGGMSWCTNNRVTTEMSNQVIPVVQQAIDRQLVVGAICDATTFLGSNGWLNEVNHTSNTLADLELVAGKRYSNAAGYRQQQAVSHRNIITANGTAYLEFTREVLLALKAFPETAIDIHYDFYKQGYYEAMKTHKIAKGI